MIPARYSKILFGFIMSGMMSFLISGISTFRSLGLGADAVGAWLSGWPISWAVSFPIVAVVAPLSQRIVAALTKPENA
ncbi:MAG: DUF2798 domain-containing protein [Alphaproteobacteria bacterium]|jgi:hypothetical protein|nr:DUF2798 domain-containing protein [Alphaproteobacteria bacterium]